MDPENQIIAEVQNGSLQSFEPLVKMYQRSVFRSINGYVCDYEIAKDLTQETFIQAFEHIHQFQFRAKFSTWLYRIAYNITTRYLQKHNKMPLSLDSEVVEDVLFANISDDSSAPFELQVDEEDNVKLIYQALDKLDPRFRGVLILHAINNIPYEEIVSITELPIGTVKSRIARAKAYLRTDLIKMGFTL